MTAPENSTVGVQPGTVLRSLFVVLAVCFLTVNVVTRYSLPVSEIHGVRTASLVKSDPHESQRQRLLSNGLIWMAPAPTSTLFQPPPLSVPAVSAIFLAINLESETWL